MTIEYIRTKKLATRGWSYRTLYKMVQLYDINQRAEYGKQEVKNLSLRLIDRYGSGWSRESLG